MHGLDEWLANALMLGRASAGGQNPAYRPSGIIFAVELALFLC